jgi:hypothetical protein
MRFPTIFEQWAVSVPCPKCRINAGNPCRNMNRKSGFFIADDGVKRFRYKPLKDKAVHKERITYWHKVQDHRQKELERQEKSEGITRQERRELEALREQIRAEQEANGVRLVSA